MRDVIGKRRVVLYSRVSQSRNETKSVPEQLAELRRDANRNTWTIVAEHTDEVSASRYGITQRQGWPSVMQLITSGEVDMLAVWEISRATRDRPVFAALLAACVEANVMIYTGGRLHDPSDADDGFALDLGGALAVRESAMTSKRTQRSVDARAAEGRPHGSVPFGYRRILDPNTGRAVGREEHPDQAPIVREVAERLIARESAHSIAQDLNRRGVPTGTGDRWTGRHLRAVVRAKPNHSVSMEIDRRLNVGELPKKVADDLNQRGVPKPVPTRWTGGNVTRMVLRPSYNGLREYRGKVLEDVTATWPALITMAQREQLLEIFSDPERDKWRNSTAVKHLGAGLYRCGRPECDGAMRVLQQPGRPNAYACRVCYRVSRNQELVDRQVQKLVIARLSRPDVIELLAETSDSEDIKTAAGEVATLKGQLREAREKVDSGELTLDDLAFFRARWEKRIAEAEKRARPRWLPSAVFDVAGPDAAERWKNQTPAAKRSILSALFTVTILPAPRRGAPFDPDLIKVTWRGQNR